METITRTDLEHARTITRVIIEIIDTSLRDSVVIWLDSEARGIQEDASRCLRRLSEYLNKELINQI